MKWAMLDRGRKRPEETFRTLHKGSPPVAVIIDTLFLIVQFSLWYSNPCCLATGEEACMPEEPHIPRRYVTFGGNGRRRRCGTRYRGARTKRSG